MTARPVGSNRNSANLTTSTLQEELIKLINVDYQTEKDDGQLKHGSSRVGDLIKFSYFLKEFTEMFI